jgi:hypothetical protein
VTGPTGSTGPSITGPTGPASTVTGPTGTSGGGGTLTWGDGNLGSSADTRLLHPSYNALSTATTVGNAVEWVAPRGGTLRNMFVRHNTANGNGTNVVYTVFVNGVATAITVTLATGAIGQASDLVNSVVIVQGDVVNITAVKAVSIANGNLQSIAVMEFA